MAQQVSHSVVQAFYQAYASRDVARIAPLLAEQVSWAIVGPCQVLPFCGEHHGKAAVMKLFDELIPAAVQFRSFEPKVLLIDGDRAATYLKLTGYLQATGRVISYHCGQFVRFQDDQVICFRSIIDSFDAAEQVLGHHIDPTHEPVRTSFALDAAVVGI